MTTYREELVKAMTALGQHPKTCVVGYNTKHSLAGGSLVGFPNDRIEEMPLAENLMVGAAIGMSLEGWMPIIFFERADFLLCAADALVNHLGRIAELSEGIHRPAAIIRVAVGNSKTPLFTGAVHTQDFSEAFERMHAFDVIRLTDASFIEGCYKYALDEAIAGRSTMCVEYRDLYAVEYEPKPKLCSPLS